MGRLQCEAQQGITKIIFILLLEQLLNGLTVLTNDFFSIGNAIN